MHPEKERVVFVPTKELLNFSEKLNKEIRFEDSNDVADLSLITSDDVCVKISNYILIVNFNSSTMIPVPMEEFMKNLENPLSYLERHIQRNASEKLQNSIASMSFVMNNITLSDLQEILKKMNLININFETAWKGNAEFVEKTQKKVYFSLYDSYIKNETIFFVQDYEKLKIDYNYLKNSHSQLDLKYQNIKKSYDNVSDRYRNMVEENEKLNKSVESCRSAVVVLEKQYKQILDRNGILTMDIQKLKETNIKLQKQVAEYADLSNPLTEKDLKIKRILQYSFMELTDMGIYSSVRTLNCFKEADIYTLGQLVVYKREDLLKFRNFGKKSLTEIDELFEQLGISFEMDVSKYQLDQEKEQAPGN